MAQARRNAQSRAVRDVLAVFPALSGVKDACMNGVVIFCAALRPALPV